MISKSFKIRRLNFKGKFILRNMVKEKCPKCNYEFCEIIDKHKVNEMPKTFNNAKYTVCCDNCGEIFTCIKICDY